MKSATHAEIIIYADIGASMFGGLSSREFATQLRELGDVANLDVRINSGGGDVFEGVAIYNLLAQHPSKVTVYVDALCASIATVIACAGDRIVMAESGDWMIHEPWTLAVGNAEDLREQIARLDAISDKIVNIYAARTGLDTDEIERYMEAETWFTADEALSLGFVDEVVASKRMAASYRRDWFKGVPKHRARGEMARKLKSMKDRLSRL
jgi:ATP-dependent Clp endopeptidase proteolytic subunit ClpP